MKKLLSLISLLGMLAMGSTPYDTLPLNIPGITAWYDFSNASTVTVSSGTVSQITDLSGNNNTLTQATTADQPSYPTTINGLNTAMFNGTTDVLNSSTTNTFATGNNPCYIFAVAYFSGASGGSSLNGLATYGNGSSRRGLAKQHNNYGIEATYPGNDQLAGVSWSTTALTIGLANYGSSTFGASGNGSTLTSLSYSPSTPSTTAFQVGGGPNVGLIYWTGPIAEIIVVNAAITTSTQQLIEGYLACKWSIQGNLPATHPYKHICPYYPNPLFFS